MCVIDAQFAHVIDKAGNKESRTIRKECMTLFDSVEKGLPTLNHAALTKGLLALCGVVRKRSGNNLLLYDISVNLTP